MSASLKTIMYSRLKKMNKDEEKKSIRDKEVKK